MQGGPVLKIFARQLMIAKVNVEEMFDVVEAGITFYSEFTGQPYPLRQYC